MMKPINKDGTRKSDIYHGCVSYYGVYLVYLELDIWRSRGAYVQTNLHGFTNKHQGFAKEILPPKDPVPEIPRTLEMAGKLADSLPETDICFWLFGVCECLWSIDIVRVGRWWYSLQTNMDGTGKLWVENKDHGLSSASLVFDDHIYIYIHYIQR